jgi:hypothetical protein
VLSGKEHLMSPSEDIATLRERLAELERENAELRTRTTSELAPLSPPVRRRTRWRAVLSAVCIVVATILVPVSTVSGWARTELVSEESFVATFGPLAEDPAVQRLVIDTASGAIIDALDVEQLTADLFDGIAALDLPAAAQSALTLLRAPATEGVKELIGTGVTTAVESDLFPQVWRTALVASHRALVATATGEGTSAVQISDTGEVGIELGPIIDAISAQLAASGFGFADAIPTIDVTIVVAQSDALPLISTVYALAVGVGWWLPLVAIALFGLGIAVARARRVAILGTGVGLAIGGFALAIALAVGGSLVTMSAPGLSVPPAALDAIYTQVVSAMKDTAVLVGIIGLLVFLLAWIMGTSRPATAVRRVTGSINESIRRWLAARGLRTGRLGAGLERNATAFHLVIVLVAVVVLALVRPLSFATTVTVVVVALLVWWATEILRPPTLLDDVPASEPVATPGNPSVDVSPLPSHAPTPQP